MSEIDGYAKWGLGSARMGLYNFSLAGGKLPVPEPSRALRLVMANGLGGRFGDKAAIEVRSSA